MLLLYVAVKDLAIIVEWLGALKLGGGEEKGWKDEKM